MRNYDDEKNRRYLTHRDRMIADCISSGIKEEVLKVIRTKYIAEHYGKYVKVFIREFNNDVINDLESEYDEEENPNAGSSYTRGNSIYLFANTVNFSTLYCGAQVSVGECKNRAYLTAKKDMPSNLVENYCIIYYDNVSDIDFADCELQNYEAYSANEDFIERFNKKNISSVIKKYSELKKELDNKVKYLEDAKAEIEKFKKGLSDEELLAINVLD